MLFWFLMLDVAHLLIISLNRLIHTIRHPTAMNTAQDVPFVA